MRRRRYLTSSASLGVSSLVGCVSSGDDISDSDGDGVIDSHDYAPQDPEVQEKADVQDVTTTGRKTPSPKPSPTPTPSPTQSPTPSPTASPKSPSSIEVDDTEFPSEFSYFVEYSLESASVRVHPNDPNVSETSNRELWVIGVGFPEGSLYATGHAAIDLSSTGTRVTVDLDWESKPTDQPLYLGTLLAPAGKRFDELTGDTTDYLHDTDTFRIQSDGGTIERAAVPELADIEDEETDAYSRTVREGEYVLEFSGRTAGNPWNVNFTLFKRGYVAAIRRDHGRARPEFVTYEMSSGFAGELAQILAEEADENGFVEKREQVEFIIDFVQHLPYVPDDVSTPYDDYTKFGVETLVELGGDCEDTTILLVSTLQSEPFNYDMVLIQPPQHMAAGIYGADDLPGYYWELDGRRYFYIETTGVGWGIGDLPEEYRDTSAYVIQV